jgi:hypothetical protein
VRPTDVELRRSRRKVNLEWDKIHRGRDFTFGLDNAYVERKINGFSVECEFADARNAAITRNFGVM